MSANLGRGLGDCDIGGGQTGHATDHKGPRGSTQPRSPARELASRVSEAATMISSTGNGVRAAIHRATVPLTQQVQAKAGNIPAIRAGKATHSVVVHRIHRSAYPFMTGSQVRTHWQHTGSTYCPSAAIALRRCRASPRGGAPKRRFETIAVMASQVCRSRWPAECWAYRNRGISPGEPESTPCYCRAREES
jgi:hypothetical protein